MIVCNILNLVPQYIKDRKGRSKKVIVITKSEGLFGELPIEEKIHAILSKSENYLTVNDIHKKIGIKKRTARKCLFRLEKKGLVKREKGNSINDNFRFGDKWIPKEKFQMDLKNKVYIKYKSKHKNNEKIHFLLLPKFIKIDEKFIRCLGLLEAEKTKFRTKMSSLEFVNSEPMMIKEVINFFENFNIIKEYWKWRIIINGNIKHIVEERKEEINDFWIKETGLSEFRKSKSSPYFTKSKGSYKIITEMGSLNLNYNNLFFHNFIENLLKNLKPIISKNKNFIWAYLSGYLCGEAYVGDRECREIQIGIKEKNQLEFIKKLLRKIGIETSFSKASSTSPPRLLICKKDYFFEIYKNGVFNMNPKKKASIIRRLVSYNKIDPKTRVILTRDLKRINNLLKERELVQKAIN